MSDAERLLSGASRPLVLGIGGGGDVVGALATAEACRIYHGAEPVVGGVSWTVRRGDTHTELGPGGEKQTCAFDEGLYLNAGPWRIPHWHTGVLDYCKELNVPLEMFVNEAEASYFFYEGAEFGPLANKRLRLREVKADLIGHTTELLAKAVSKDALEVPLSAEDKDRLVSFLVTEGYLDNASYAYVMLFAAMTLMLLVRPRGLFGARRRE